MADQAICATPSLRPAVRGTVDQVLLESQDQSEFFEPDPAFNDTAEVVRTLIECRQILEATQVARNRRKSRVGAVACSARAEPSEVMEPAAELRLKEALESNCPDMGTVWDSVRTVRAMTHQVLEFRGGISASRRFGQHSIKNMVANRRKRMSVLDVSEHSPRSEDGQELENGQDSTSPCNTPWDKIPASEQRALSRMKIANRIASSHPLTWLHEDSEIEVQTPCTRRLEEDEP